MKITVKCPAKINLSLDVLKKREDGYHEVEMVMQSVSLYDVVTVEKRGRDITLDCNFPYVPADERNIAYKAAKAFFEYTGIKDAGIHISIEKSIPVAAGLAGGSTDAAGVLIGLNRLFDKKLDDRTLMAAGAKIGADIPFCIKGGTAVCRGLGDIVTQITPLAKCFFVLVKPPVSISTPKIYGLLDKKPVISHPFTNELIKSIEKGDITLMSKYLYNVLEEVTEKESRYISDIRTKLSDFSPLGAVMSGSGSTVYAVFNNYDKAEACCRRMKKIYSQTFICTPCGGPSVE